MLCMDHTEQTGAFVFLKTAKTKAVRRLQRAEISNGNTLPVLRSACKHLVKCEDCDSDLLKSPLKSAEAAL